MKERRPERGKYMRNLYILVSPRRIQVDSALHRTAVEGRNVHAVHVFLQNVFLQNAHANDTIMMSVMVVSVNISNHNRNNSKNIRNIVFSPERSGVAWCLLILACSPSHSGSSGSNSSRITAEVGHVPR